LGIPVQVTEINLGYKWHLHSADKDGVRIAHPCNAFELYFLYVAFIVAFANVPLLRKWKFAVLGLLALYLFNILRVVLLFYVSGKWPDFFDFMHKYLFQAGAYILMFGLWYWLLHQRSHGK
jgi:exosortase/archaeosortase family protein